MRILLIRTSALGDVVQCLPVLTALRRHLPQARIGWVIEKSMAPLLQEHPDLDEVLAAELRGWRRHPFSRQTSRGIGTLLASMERFAPDVVLDLMGNHKAGVLAALTFCDRRVGLKRAYRREPSSAWWINEGVTPRGSHAVDRALSVVEALGLPREPADFGSEKLRGAFAGNGSRLPATGDDPYVVLHPGAAWANKRYPPAQWGEVACRFRAATGLRVLVAPGPGEAELGRQVVEAGAGSVELVDAPDLPALGKLLGGARLVMGGDTGPVHLAHALGTTVLCLMGPTDPRKHGPYNAPHLAMWEQLPCSFCHQRLSETKACLLELAPEAVARRATELVNGARGTPAPGTSARSAPAD